MKKICTLFHITFNSLSSLVGFLGMEKRHRQDWLLFSRGQDLLQTVDLEFHICPNIKFNYTQRQVIHTKMRTQIKIFHPIVKPTNARVGWDGECGGVSVVVVVLCPGQRVVLVVYWIVGFVGCGLLVLLNFWVAGCWLRWYCELWGWH